MTAAVASGAVQACQRFASKSHHEGQNWEDEPAQARNRVEATESRDGLKHKYAFWRNSWSNPHLTLTMEDLCK